MAPKINANPTKLATILHWFHSSGVAHSIKDLEKALPSVGSISGMHVKDYLQALSDENHIHVEKIGSGNWYWAFAGEESANLGVAIDKEELERDRLQATINELSTKVDVETEARRDSPTSDDSQVLERDVVLVKYNGILKEVQALKNELSAHKDNDPIEVDKARAEAEELRRLAEKWTDQITEMERYMKDRLGMDPESLVAFERELFGKEFGEEEQGLSDLWLPA